MTEDWLCWLTVTINCAPSFSSSCWIVDRVRARVVAFPPRSSKQLQPHIEQTSPLSVSFRISSSGVWGGNFQFKIQPKLINLWESNPRYSECGLFSTIVVVSMRVSNAWVELVFQDSANTARKKVLRDTFLPFPHLSTCTTVHFIKAFA